MTQYPKRLIEVDLPTKAISRLRGRRTHKQDVDVRRPGIWWSRKPQHQCRAIWIAALLPDPADPLVSNERVDALRRVLHRHGMLSKHGSSTPEGLRSDLFSLCEYLAGPDTVVSASGESLLHELAELFEFKALVTLDPFAGGGSIPVEAQRLGANSIAGECNPLATLYLQYLMEWGPRSDDVILDQLASLIAASLSGVLSRINTLFPPHPDHGQPFGYIRFRQLTCEGPGCGCVVPATSKFELDRRGRVGLTFSEPPYPGRSLSLQLMTNPKDGFPRSTIRSGALECPACQYVTTRNRVMRQRERTLLPTIIAAVAYRVGSKLVLLPPTPEQVEADHRASHFLVSESLSSFIPGEPWPRTEPRRFSPPLYGLRHFADCHTPRQQAFLASLCKSLMDRRHNTSQSLYAGVVALLVGRAAETNTAFCRWRNDRGGSVEGTFAGKSIGMIWDFFEADPVHPEHNLKVVSDDLIKGLRVGRSRLSGVGTVLQSPVQELSLPDDSVDVLYTDPPYYDSVPYSHLSDWPSVWIKKLGHTLGLQFGPDGLAPKCGEIVVDRPHSMSPSTHDEQYFRHELKIGLERCHQMLKEGGIGIIVFAHLKTSAWESLLESLLAAGFRVTASWPVVTERGGRLQAQRTASLQSSIHLVVRPRKLKGGGEVGDWRDVLAELPKRIHEWLPRLAKEGVVGADAIFACVGPALEIFSRYSHVEKASGEEVSLRDYLEQVWAAVSKEALNMIFTGADATGFEEDSRLTAMWLWTLSTGTNGNDKEEEDGQATSKTKKLPGYALEFDAARKIAQGLGAHLEKLTGVVEVRGDTARLLSVAERTKYLFGKDEVQAPVGRRRKKDKQEKFDFAKEVEEAESKAGGWGEKTAPRAGQTVLDQLHQAMILFAAGRGEAMKRFLVEEGIGRDGRFWRLAQALSALYPKNSDEKRWVDGVLARKKGLGF